VDSTKFQNVPRTSNNVRLYYYPETVQSPLFVRGDRGLLHSAPRHRNEAIGRLKGEVHCVVDGTMAEKADYDVEIGVFGVEEKVHELEGVEQGTLFYSQIVWRGKRMIDRKDQMLNIHGKGRQMKTEKKREEERSETDNGFHL
jgi:hypothetical protein